MLLNVLADALLVLPLNLLLFSVVGLVLWWRWPRFGRWLLTVSLLGLFLLSLPVVSQSLIVALESGLQHPPPTAGPPAAIVILGGDAGYGTDAGVDPGIGIGPLTWERMRAGELLQRRTGLPVLVTGAALAAGVDPIATLMARSLHDEFGITVRWVEPAAANTWENAEFSAAMLHAAGINSVYLVSQAWHLRRAAMAFARFGIATTPAPLRFERTPRFTVDEFYPTISALRSSYFALHEWIGCAYYALRS